MAVSKKIRFEVFKRDSFTCVYCGCKPPEVVLECDHIDPVSKGGSDDINNLVTACFDCNRGKSNRTLEKIPSKLSENIEVLQEQESQLKEYRKFINKLNKRIERDIDTAEDVFKEYYEDYSFTDDFRSSVKMFLRKLPIWELEDSMRIACSMMPNGHSAIKYFCGICWNKIRDCQNG